jgi:hypothetical protein
MDIKLNFGKTLREALVDDFGLLKEKVDLMTDDEVNKEILTFSGESRDY